jgi:hypothetical protein
MMEGNQYEEGGRILTGHVGGELNVQEKSYLSTKRGAK